MPGGDGRGPRGRGPRDGRGRGQGGGQGVGKGRRGVGGRGRGTGPAPGKFVAPPPSSLVIGKPVPGGEKAKEDEFARLRERAQILAEQLQAVQERMAELGKGRRASTVVATVDTERCIACGSCLRVCPEGAITINDTAHVEWGTCTGCGVCIPECPERALSLARAPSA